MSQSIEERMLDALELFQYAYRFRHSLFVLVLEKAETIAEVLTDLRLLQAAHIRCVIVLRHEPELERTISTYNQRGQRFTFILHTRQLSGEQSALARARWAIKNENIPIVSLGDIPPKDGFPRELYSQAVQVATNLVADKVFFMTPFEGLEIDGMLQSHVSAAELTQVITEGIPTNVPHELLSFLEDETEEQGLDFVLVKAEAGSLFQEVFTHLGEGTLITEEYPTSIRRGTVRDVADIGRLLKPYIMEGTILALSDDEIAAVVESFFVYTVNDALVAASQLVDYGEAAELAKFCTLPRFQGKGRARELALRMLEVARLQDKQYVFALSIAPKMWAFFQSLGFSEMPREDLPNEWKAKYDFSRPSKAFALYFD